MKNVDVAIIGGGPAGMSAAVACYEKGVRDILVIDRDEHLGGILQQCIHNGFGLHMFKEELTGPEYAQRYIDKLEEYGIRALTDTMVLEITPDKQIYAINPDLGLVHIQAKAIVLCMGCRERTRANLIIPGTRPAGVFNAGTAQRLTNMEGYMPGKEVVILGSGDIGLIMARRLTSEGANIKMVLELMPYSTGLQRNIHQCLNDYNIPLHFNHTVVKIHGKYRVEGVTIAKVDENRRPIKESEQFVACDTLLLSVGLIPENELANGIGVRLNPITSGPFVDAFRQTNIPGVFAAGNTLHVHDLVDYVSEEGTIAAEGVVRYLKATLPAAEDMVPVKAGAGIRYIVPERIPTSEPTELYFRPDNVYTDGKLHVMAGDEEIYSRKFIRMAPGEMDRLMLSKEMLGQAGGREISLRCK